MDTKTPTPDHIEDLWPTLRAVAIFGAIFGAVFSVLFKLAPVYVIECCPVEDDAEPSIRSSLEEPMPDSPQQNQALFIGDLDPVDVLYELYSRAMPLGMGRVAEIERRKLGAPTRADFEAEIATNTSTSSSGRKYIKIDYLWGRPIKVNLAEAYLDPSLYDRDAGQGMGALAVAAARGRKVVSTDGPPARTLSTGISPDPANFSSPTPQGKGSYGNTPRSGPSLEDTIRKTMRDLHAPPGERKVMMGGREVIIMELGDMVVDLDALTPEGRARLDAQALARVDRRPYSAFNNQHNIEYEGKWDAPQARRAGASPMLHSPPMRSADFVDSIEVPQPGQSEDRSQRAAADVDDDGDDE